MHDPLDDLKELSIGTPTTRLPAEEVRRRGERRRHRRTAFQTAAAALAVVAVVSGGALFSGGLTRTLDEPQPADGRSAQAQTSEDAEPRNGWTTRIPVGFRIDDGLPQTGGENGVRQISQDLWAPWALDPCQEGSTGGVSRSDFLGLAQAVDVVSYRRQLAVYADDVMAREAMASFAEEVERCPNHQNDEPGGVFSEDEWVSYDKGLQTGDESFTVVRHRRQSGLRLAPATLYTAARVGNAVLLAAHDGRFGEGSRQDIEQVALETTRAASAVVERMCVFALDPCATESPDADGDWYPYALGVEAVRRETGLDEWQVAADGDWAPMLCAEDHTEGLGDSRTVTRYFEAGVEDRVRARAVATVLEFDLSTRAAEAYDVARRWLATCDQPLDRRHRILAGEDALGDLHTGRHRFGLMAWRTATSTAPEICADCDARWLNHQGVTLAGGRLVLVQVSYARTADGMYDDVPSPMPGILRAAGRLASGDY